MSNVGFLDGVFTLLDFKIMRTCALFVFVWSFEMPVTAVHSGPVDRRDNSTETQESQRTAESIGEGVCMC